VYQLGGSETPRKADKEVGTAISIQSHRYLAAAPTNATSPGAAHEFVVFVLLSTRGSRSKISTVFGLQFDKDVVRCVLAKYYRPIIGDGGAWPS
jgi:hypothetical protein